MIRALLAIATAVFLAGRVVRPMPRHRPARRHPPPPSASRDALLHAFTTTIEHVDQGIMMVDANGVVVVFNQQVVDMLGLPETLLPSRPRFLDVLNFQLQGDEFQRTSGSLIEAIREGGIANIPPLYERERPDGSTIEVRTRLLAGGEMVRTFTDVTDRKRAQAVAERAVMFDDLTGLPTRVAVLARLKQWLGDTPDGASGELLMISLDRLRLLNGARGYEVGDRLLIDLGEQLRRTCPAGAIVGRVGGNQFAVFHTEAESLADGGGLAERLLTLVAEPHRVDGTKLSVTASIGVVSVRRDCTASTLLRNAEIALNQAKDLGRNQICRFTAAISAAQHERFQVEQLLRDAINGQTLRLAFQPIVAVESRAVFGYEALLRWTDRVRGDMSPAMFVPVAEATGLIVPLGRQVLEQACMEAASWPNQRTIAVNLSPAQFLGDDLVGTVRGALLRSGLTPARLELEVTEGLLLEETGAVLETMNALRSMGVRFTLDDFGAGHAGLSYLRRFPFEKMKIDASFVRALDGDGDADAIVEAILLLGRRLDMSVVAEGVETEAQFNRLRSMHCPFVQGFLTGRPMAAEMARAL